MFFQQQNPRTYVVLWSPAFVFHNPQHLCSVYYDQLASVLSPPNLLSHAIVSGHRATLSYFTRKERGRSAQSGSCTMVWMGKWRVQGTGHNGADVQGQLWQFQSLSPISWDEGLDHQFTLIQNRPFALTRIQPCCPISWKQQQLVRIWLTIGPSAFANIYIQGSSQPAGGVHISSESDVIPACQVYSSL